MPEFQLPVTFHIENIYIQISILSPPNLLFQSIHHLGISTSFPKLPRSKVLHLLAHFLFLMSHTQYQQIPKPVTSESTTTFFHLDHCKSFLSSLPPSCSPKSSFLHSSQVIFLAFLCSKPASGFPFLCAFTVYEVLDNLALDYGSVLPSTTCFLHLEVISIFPAHTPVVQNNSVSPPDLSAGTSYGLI